MIRLVVPSHNCGRWVDRCLGSVMAQTRSPDSVLLIDDGSDEEGYRAKLAEWGRVLGAELRFLPERVFSPRSLFTALRAAGYAPEDVVFILDGDDSIPPYAIERIAEVYADPQVWLTYGSYEPEPENTGQDPAMPYGETVDRDRTWRTAPHCFNHPRTFRYKLFQALTEDEMKNDAGQWFTGGADFVFIVPMLELAGAEHYRFLTEVLYRYNAVNPMSDTRVNLERILETAQIKRRPRRDPL